MSAIDNDVVRSRLTLLQHHLRRVDARCPGALQERVANEDTQDIVAFNLQKAFEHALEIRSAGSDIQG